MKKLIAFLLSLCMLPGLVACGSSDAGASGDEAKKPAGLLAGVGKINITPDFPVGLKGYKSSSERIFDTVRDYLYMTCIAVREGDTTGLLITADIQNWTADMLAEAPKLIAAATGVPESHMLFGATHTHTAPSVVDSADASKEYRKLFMDAAVEAAQTAIADLAPAAASYGTMEVEGMNFVRHYVHSDGQYSGSNFNEHLPKETIVGHTAEADKQLILIKFDRAEKDDILMVNWQAHPDVVPEVGFKTLSGGAPVYMCSKLEDETGMVVAYFSGAEGNLNGTTWIPSEDHGLKMVAYGEKMADYALQVLENMTPAEGTAVRAAQKQVTVEFNHQWDHLLVQAREVQSVNSKQGRDAATAHAQQYGISSAYHANAIVSRVNMPASETLPVGAMAVGNIGFICGTYEMFCENGMYVKEKSPFPVTFVVTGNNCYIPSQAAYDYRCYEADTGYYIPGTGEMLAEEFLNLLEGF